MLHACTYIYITRYTLWTLTRNPQAINISCWRFNIGDRISIERSILRQISLRKECESGKHELILKDRRFSDKHYWVTTDRWKKLIPQIGRIFLIRKHRTDMRLVYRKIGRTLSRTPAEILNTRATRLESIGSRKGRTTKFSTYEPTNESTYVWCIYDRQRSCG